MLGIPTGPLAGLGFGGVGFEPNGILELQVMLALVALIYF
jgi:hypothetical protein